MIQHDTLERCYAWFDRFTGQFSSGDPLVAANLIAKAEHIKCVARNARAIAKALQLSSEQRALAEVLGLFHDVGRFPQLVEFGTFRDSISGDHAAASVQVLDAEELWRHFTEEEHDILAAAVQHHNKFALPAGLTGDTLLFCRLIRDADKLDGLKRTAEGHTFTLLGVDEEGAVSPAIREAILDCRCARYADIQTRQDTILAIVGHIYNINFPHAFAMIREEDYLPRIFARLPRNDDFAHLQETVQAFIDKQA
jgi:hypothetical protein